MSPVATLHASDIDEGMASAVLARKRVLAFGPTGPTCPLGRRSWPWANYSLLVLGGTASGRQRDRDEPLPDVLKAAAGRVRAYQRVEMGLVDDAAVRVGVVNDPILLLAELGRGGGSWWQYGTATEPPQEAARKRMTADQVRSAVEKLVSSGALR